MKPPFLQEKTCSRLKSDHKYILMVNTFAVCHSEWECCPKTMFHDWNDSNNSSPDLSFSKVCLILVKVSWYCLDISKFLSTFFGWYHKLNVGFWWTVTLLVLIFDCYDILNKMFWMGFIIPSPPYLAGNSNNFLSMSIYNYWIWIW